MRLIMKSLNLKINLLASFRSQIMRQSIIQCIKCIQNLIEVYFYCYRIIQKTIFEEEIKLRNDIELVLSQTYDEVKQFCINSFLRFKSLVSKKLKN
jgi:hypothetical protein